MNYFVFARLGGHFLLLDGVRDPRDITSVNSQLFHGDSLAEIIESGVGSAEQLARVFGGRIDLSTRSRYTIVTDDNWLLVIPSEGGLFRRSHADAAETEARHRVEEFELATKSRLIDALYSTNTSLGQYVEAWTDYFLCDHYALWIYNRHTKVFTCSLSSFDVGRDYVFTHEGSSLNRALTDDYTIECRAPSADLQSVEGMNTVSAIKLALGYDGTIGVLALYSRYANYELEPRNYAEIRNSIETKYQQVRQQAYQAMDQVNQQFIETYKAGHLDEFLFDIACQIGASLQAEACSIFLVDGDHLDLVASCDNRVHGKPVEPYSYALSGGSPTAAVFNNMKMAFSYDLATDDPNDDGYSESTDHDPKNWIGVPLISAGQCYGVVRVRNRYEVDPAGGTSIVNFRSGDFTNLLSLCSNLANLMRIESLFHETQSKLNATSASMDEMNDFNKVFLHEIRTPISKFTMAPEIIKRTLSQKNVTRENREKVMRQLDDIQVMGDRLEFIAKTFNFNQIVTRRNFETLSVLRDVVFPVINITRAYLQKQYDIDIQLDTTGLGSSRVYGDKTLLNIVFNTLIDNAGKYSVGTRRPINVSGGYQVSGDFFDLVVSNYGLAIHEDEKDELFDNGVRGREAVRQGIGGTGIGLHLAQRIMKEGGGELLLTSTKDPVSFTLSVPARPRGQET